MKLCPKETEANEQHIDELRAAASTRAFKKQIIFVVGNRGLDVESDFYT